MMKKREIRTTGKIDNNGKLCMFMEEINNFFTTWRAHRVIATFNIVSSGTSEALRGYYFGVVVPSFKMAFWELGERMSEADAEARLRSLSPIMYNETVDIKTGEYHIELRAISDLSNDELIEHIETLKQIAAENFNLYIEDPNIF